MDEYLIITDTSCLILLDNIQALELLHVLYANIITTPEIAREFGQPLPLWIKVVSVENKALTINYNEQVDLGEASAIALARESINSILIIDDLKARKLAAQLNLRFTGTVGVLITARQKKLIQSLRPYFELIRSTDFRISPALLKRILDDYGD